MLCLFVVRRAEGAPGAPSGARETSDSGRGLSSGISCRLELQGAVLQEVGRGQGGQPHSPPGSGPPPLCGGPVWQQRAWMLMSPGWRPAALGGDTSSATC